MSKHKGTKVYHVEVVKKVSTSFDENNDPINKVSKGIIKFVGDEEMAQFIGYTEKRDKDGRMQKTPKVGYHKQLGYLKAKCVRVCDKKAESLDTQDEDMARVNSLLNPPKVKTATESITERLDRLEAENEALRAENAKQVGTPAPTTDAVQSESKRPSKTRGNKS